MPASKQELIGFVLVGGIGFVVDAVSLMLFFHVLGVGPYLSRVLAFGIAVTVTWVLNRTFTFQVDDNIRIYSEYVTYLATQIIGVAINFGVYATGIMLSKTMAMYPVIALALGSGVAMVANFIAMKCFVFKTAS